MDRLPLARSVDIVLQETSEELLVYDLQLDKAYCLNTTAATVFNACDGQRTVAEISDLLSQKLKTPVSEDLVWLALDQLKKDNLLDPHESIAINFGGLSRRQVVKKIGLASMAMLPVVSSIVAPQTVNAQSCLPPGSFLACSPPTAPDLAMICTPLRTMCCSGNYAFGGTACPPGQFPCVCSP